MGYGVGSWERICEPAQYPLSNGSKPLVIHFPMRYKLKIMDSASLPPEVQWEKKGWEFVCENHHGVAYWNTKTGEFCWVNTDKNKASLSSLVSSYADSKHNYEQ